MDWVSAGLTAFSVGSSLLGGKSADDAAKEAAEAEIKLLESRAAEQERQMGLSAAIERGTARAAIGASNIQFDGSSMDYLRALDYENMREQARYREDVRLQKEAIKAGARGAGDAYRYQAAGDLIGYAAGAYANRTRAPAPTQSFGSSQGSPFINPAMETYRPSDEPYVAMSPVVK